MKLRRREGGGSGHGWKLGAAAGVAAVLIGATGPLAAQGFSLNEQSACAMSRANAGVAAPCGDGSAVVYNPAALADLRGWHTSLGATLIATGGEFTSDDTRLVTDLETDPVPAPHGYLAWGPTPRLGVAIGAFVPYGLETTWPRSFDGRFSGYDNSLQTFYVQPTAAYRLSDAIAIGAGLDFAIGSVELHQRLDLSQQRLPGGGGPSTPSFGALGIPFHTDFADAGLKADGATGVGGHVGLQVRASDRLRFGARYLSQITLDYDGRARFEPVPTGIRLPADNPFGVPAGTPLDALLQSAGVFAEGGAVADQGVTTSIAMPDQVVAGVALDATDRLLLAADWQWIDWSDFDRIVLDFEQPQTPDEVRVEDYRDTHTLRLGAEYEAGSGVVLRGGYARDGPAAPEDVVTPLLPEAARNQFSLGGGWRSDAGFGVDVGYLYIAQEDRRGRTVEPRSDQLPSLDLNNGVYGFTGHLFALSLTYRF